ncbi:hypothetical protein [Cellulomonas carbonis]|uniref:Uncharacterized protein n=1 Tax=Cellulomonas carbonis T26 TaxID=947969 RepID=A0A0A0BME8_9CELL|nr:hypothetical protein [Cellulomonas carbonis]KGM09131.1 hypothetical protein N868_04380 [Cellulomonas carbonis T26]GGB96050.1 hypothetical protein GCM10010972_05990 [Cellulomonas carbonis]
MTRRARGTWWARNRLGVVGLPVALLAALAASSERIPTYLWPSGLHAPQRAPAGEWLDFADDYTADGLEHTRAVRVRVDSVEPAPAGWTTQELPDGTVGVQVRLTLSAAPDVPLVGCTLALRGADGTRYDHLPGAVADQGFSPCVPSDAPGPMVGLDGSVTPSDAPRPATWTTSPVVLVPEGTDPSEVVLWWEMPDYASFALD